MFRRPNRNGPTADPGGARGPGAILFQHKETRKTVRIDAAQECVPQARETPKQSGILTVATRNPAESPSFSCPINDRSRPHKCLVLELRCPENRRSRKTRLDTTHVTAAQCIDIRHGGTPHSANRSLDV